MEKPWCVYRGILGDVLGVGKIVGIRDDGVYLIVASENQKYPEPWDPKHIESFPTLKEALDYYIKNRSEVDIRTMSKTYTKKGIMKIIKRSFPSEITD